MSVGDYSIGIGQSFNNSIHAARTIAIGYGVRALGASWSVIIGENSGETTNNVNSIYGVVLGYQAKLSANYVVAIGSNSLVTNDYGVAIGSSASVSGDSSIALGRDAISNNNYGVAIGYASQGNSQSSIAIGSNTISAGEQGICIGTSSSVSGTWSIGIGSFVNASHTKSIAIGTNALSQAQEAIQLGSGTNRTTGSLQFRDYQLVNSRGIIPYERLSEDTPTSGYVLSYDSANDCLTWTENGQGGGGYELPIASASTLGGIKVGDGLQINSSTGVLSVTGGQGGGDGIWGQITGDIQDQTDLMNILNSKFEQSITMPAPNESYNNKIVQFIGISDLLYKHGYVYECQYKQIDFFLVTSSDYSRFGITSINVQRFNAFIREYYPEVDLDRQYQNETFAYDSSDNKWHIDLLDVNEDPVSIAIETFNLQYMGIGVQYYGLFEPEDGDEMYVSYLPVDLQTSSTIFGYVWERVNVQPYVNVIDNTASTSSTDALSARQGKVLSDKIETLESIGQFLAIWDCNKNGYNARYLDDGYQYQRGNYFIVGAVEEWNIDPEAGPVTVSFDTNNQVAISHGYTTYADEMKTYNRYKPTTDATFKFTWDVSSQKWYDETKHTYINAGSLLSTIGFCPSYGGGAGEVQAADLVEGDYFEVLYTHTHNYFPVGDTYYEDPNAGCVRTYEDVQVSDMIFYDGTNWVLLANHSKQTAVDHDLDPASKNPVENATITAALNTKLNKTSEANRIYGTTSLGEQVALTVGTGLSVANGTLTNTVDVSGKQDTLVSGVNIKTINDQSILGSGNIVIQGGGGSSDAVGTCNISNVFTGWYIKEDGEEGEGIDKWKGNPYDLMFTLNAPLDYIKENKNDLYVTFSRRNTQSAASNRAWRMLDDQRKKTNLKMYCWRYDAGKYFDNEFETWVNDYDGNHYNDLRYIYFYTLSDYSNDVDELLNDNPKIWYADLRHQGDTSIEDENFSQGNWGTCFNELAEYGSMSDKWDDRWGDYDNFERCARYDISEVQVDDYVEYNPKEDTIWLDKMRGKLYKTASGDKVYLWSNCWWDDGAVYAILDGNDDPIYNKVPSDMSELSYFCDVSELESKDLAWAEDRNDLDYRRFNLSESYKADFVNHCRECSTSSGDPGSYDTKPRCYLRDYPIRPVRLSECRIFMKYGAPHHYDPEEGVYTNDYYNREYYEHAYTLDQIENNPDLLYMLQAQKEIIFVYPYDTFYLWMRNLGWQRMVYEHAEIYSDYDYDEEEWRSDVFSWDYEWDGEEPGEGTPYHTTDPETGDYARTRNTEENPFYVKPWDRHNLIRAMFLCGKRNKEIQCGYDDWTMGQFDNNMGFFNGTHKQPRWKMKQCTVYYYPVQFNINTGKQLSKGPTSNSTPFNVTLQLSDAGNQNIKVM